MSKAMRDKYHVLVYKNRRDGKWTVNFLNRHGSYQFDKYDNWEDARDAAFAMYI